MKDLGNGAGYRYDHEANELSQARSIFRTAWRGEFYRPRARGFEREIARHFERSSAAGTTDAAPVPALFRRHPLRFRHLGGTLQVHR